LVQTFDENTGELLAVTTGAPGAQISGTGIGSFPAPAGACQTWRTGGVHFGHKVTGRTFLVPLSQAAFDTDGTLLNAVITEAATAAAALIAAPVGFGVWSRPKPARPDPNDPGTTLPPEPGAIFAVQAGSLADKAAVLRSRRD